MSARRNTPDEAEFRRRIRAHLGEVWAPDEPDQLVFPRSDDAPSHISDVLRRYFDAARGTAVA